MRRTAFLAIVGCPNVGKSSLLNTLLGEKIAIVSNKPQTTRTRIMGLLTRNDRQLVFTDTPGIHRSRTKLGEHMMQAVQESVDGVDAVILVVSAQSKTPRDEETRLLERLQKSRTPVLLAINKIDLQEQKETVAAQIAQWSERFDFAAIVPISVKTGDNMDALRNEIFSLFKLPNFTAGDGFYFPEDTLTDQPERVIAAELIREQILRYMDQEIPHGTMVVVEKMKEREGADLIDIEANIFCERDSHKGMLIGKGGAMLKRISTAARLEMERFFSCRIHLQCWVKVKEGWRDRESVLRDFLPQK
ncbi:MAG: GTPase Era [Oscillospiraceae bacterium]|jgi:GTP-binding protein Era|nr:GTPase Era [Oscillospiraceae bacterium]